MTYWQFLAEWYNAAFLLLGLAGAALAVASRLSGRDLIEVAVALMAAAVVGLTWNGAIHDLSLGSPAPRFPYVLAVSLALGWLIGRGLSRVRQRYFRPISAVRFNRPGHEGTEARLVTRTTGIEPGSGRAQWQDEEGVLHIVHAHTGGAELGFGLTVRLERFDAGAESYLVTRVSKGRSGRRGGGGSTSM